MGLGKPQRFANFELAGFIYYGNIREFVFKNGDKPKWGKPLFLEKLTLPLDSQTQCFVFDMQLLWSYDYSKWAIFTKKPHFTNFGGCKVGGRKFLHQTTKRHTFTPNLVAQIVWRMWQWRCFDTRRREKCTRESPLDTRCRLYAATAPSLGLGLLLVSVVRCAFMACTALLMSSMWTRTGTNLSQTHIVVLYKNDTV